MPPTILQSVSSDDLHRWKKFSSNHDPRRTQYIFYMISEICERANSVRIKKKLAFRPRLSCKSDTWSPHFCSLAGWSTKLYVGAVSFRRNETCFRSYDHNQELVSNKRLQSQLTFHLNLPHDLHTPKETHYSSHKQRPPLGRESNLYKNIFNYQAPSLCPRDQERKRPRPLRHPKFPARPKR